MTEMSVLFTKSECSCRDYFKKELQKIASLQIEQTSNKSMDCIVVKSDNKLLNDYVWGAIVDTIQHYYKYEMVTKKLFKTGEINLAESLIIGALLGFDAQDERAEIILQLAKCGRVIHINGFVQFMLYDIVKNWKSLISLATRLLLQCRDKRDYLDIVFFLMATSCAIDKKVFVYSNNKNIIINVDGEEIVVPPLTSNQECDAIMALIAVCPTEIKIASGANVSKQFYSTVKCIGDHIAISQAMLDN